MSDVYRNPHFYDRWSTPCCNAEINGGNEGIRACPECGESVLCTSEEIPQSVCSNEPADIEDYRMKEGEG